MSQITSLVLCDNSPLVLSGIVQLFETDPRFVVKASMTESARFLEAIDRHNFDIGVMGWNMPYCSGQEALRRLKENHRAPRIVIYTGDGSVSIPRQAMIEGAAGFCSKKEPPERLVETVSMVSRGSMVFPFMDVGAATADPLETLSPRETELLKALADGLTNSQIAKSLNISLNTVKFHLKNLYQKLGVGSRSQAISRYLRGTISG
ncbi:MAG: response regulator transcription factor [Rhodospirillales bacterium]|nr:response regulator transcription factor [Rhodospirillales bacterium]